MKSLTATLKFIASCIIVGLAIACVAILLNPSLLGGNNDAKEPLSYADAVQASAHSVVNIYTTRLVLEAATDEHDERVIRQTSLGSGVIIDAAGYIVTNFHVISDAAQNQVHLADGRIALAMIVGTDADTDLALLKIDLMNLTPIRFGRSDQLRIGDIVLAIGNPYGLSQTVTQGIVSATGRGLLGLTTFENYIQTDAAINSGNSGGALINTRGELIGINTAVISREVNIQGISFAIPVNLVSGVVRELRDKGRVPRGWLGLNPADLTFSEYADFGLEQDDGILLANVLQGGPAWAAGIRAGDILLKIDNQSIANSQQALLQVAAYEPGTNVELTYLRNGFRQTTTAVTGDRALAPGAR